MIKLHASFRLRAAINASGAKYDTPAKLLKFFLSIGFTKKAGVGIFTKTAFASKLAPLKDEWNIKKGKDHSGAPTMVGTNKHLPGATFTLTSYPPQTFLEIDESSFPKDTGPVDIYKVTKYHPAWELVNSVVDNLKDKKEVKKAVDRFMAETGMKADELESVIKDRTARKISSKFVD